MTQAQGKQNCWNRFVNFLLCASNDPEAPKKSCKTKFIDCLKPNTDDAADAADAGEGGPARETWKNRCTFFLTTLGMSVGLGQVWRFPTLAYSMGGGAFLIIYGVMIFTIGNALFFFEVTTGQYTSKNPLKAFDKVPIFQGIGWSMIAYSYLFCTYYSHMVAFSLYYLFQCFTARLPWSFCPEKQEIPDSYTCMAYPKHRAPGLDAVVCGNSTITYNYTLFITNSTYAEEQQKACCAIMGLDGDACKKAFDISELSKHREYPSQYFWNHVVNKVYRNDDPMHGYVGPVNYALFGCSFLSWFLAFVVLYKGIKSLGVFMYIMVPLPYIILIIMFAIVIPQEGAAFGLKEFFVPKLQSFYDITVWRTAIEQAFYSLGVAMGPLITFGSYVKFSNPSHIDAVLICLCIFLTSVLCSLVVFSVLGFLSVKTGKPFQKVVESGPGLVFIVYPESLELLPGAQFFSVLFYLMLINLGMSSVTGIIETVSSTVYDIWTASRRYKYLVNLGVLMSCFLIGIPMTCRGGLDVYNAFDIYAGGIPLIPICGLEILVIIFLYGLGRFCEDLAFMLGFYPNRYYRYLWMVTPFILFTVFIYGLVVLNSGGLKIWAQALGWFLFVFIMIMIPIGIIYQIVAYKKKGNIKGCVKPPPDHGPKKDSDRQARNDFSVKRKIF